MAPYLENCKQQSLAVPQEQQHNATIQRNTRVTQMIHQQRCGPPTTNSSSNGFFRSYQSHHHQHPHQQHYYPRHHGTTGASQLSSGTSLRSNNRTSTSSISTRAQSNANTNNNTTTTNNNNNNTSTSKQTAANTRSRAIIQNRQQEQQQLLHQHQTNSRLQLNGASLRASNDQLVGGARSANVTSSSGANNQNNATTNQQNNTQDHLCDNSNDSGLGFEERQQQLIKAVQNAAAAPLTRYQRNRMTIGMSTPINQDRWMRHCREVQDSNDVDAANYEWNGVVNGICQEEKKKRRKMDIKLECEDANFAFPEGAAQHSETKLSTRNGANATSGRGSTTVVNGAVNRVVGVTRPRPHLGVVPKKPPAVHQGPITLTSQLNNLSRNGKTQLQIVCQPEQQHRARYQTEGSRGAVKDRTGNGFPIVRLVGYDKPTTLQVFIGTDLGRVAPHMFYQACRVSGKNSTPCVERKIDGTIVIEVEMEPVKDMLITCDCVGILKERNVDVEHRFPQEAVTLQGRSKKKSTRCRMVFRTTITHDDGTNETLQVCSQPIVCTQPPGIPEICKKSLTACPCTGGLELFILGKNFLKDTRIVFQLDREDMNSALEGPWECTVIPDKEFLQQTHLVCVVPPYRRVDLLDNETITVRLFAVSSGKTSEPHTFLYTAASSAPAPSVGKVDNAPDAGDVILAGKLPTAPAIIVPGSISTNGMHPQTAPSNFLGSIAPASTVPTPAPTEVLKSDPSPPPVTVSTPVTSVMMWNSPTTTNNPSGAPADVMMPPPPNNLVSNPLMSRRSSANLLILPDNLKTEVLDENSQSSLIGENSMSGMPSAPPSVPSPLEQLVNDNSRDSSQNSLIRSNVPVKGSPVQDSLLGVVDIMRNQHQLSILPQQPSFNALHDSNQVKVLSPHNTTEATVPVMTSEPSITNTLQGSPDVVDLRMKHHQAEFNGIGNGNLGSFAATPPDQPLPAQSGHSIQKYLEQIETAPKKPDMVQDANFVRASIITSNQVSPITTSLLTQNPTVSVPALDELVNSTVDSHQIISPVSSSPNAILSQVVDQEGMQTASPQQSTSSPIPVKNILMEALMPAPSVSPMVVNGTTSPVANVGPLPVQLSEPTPEDSLLKSLLPSIQESPIVSVSAISSSSPNTTTHNPMQVSDVSDVLPGVASAINQALASDPVTIQQVQQVEQVVAQAQQEVQQVVAQVHQQAFQTVQQAQQQVVQQVVAHAQVVQQAVKKVQEVQQAPAAPAIQQAVTQASQEVVQQAMHQTREEAKKQVHAVREAVQQAQAAQAMQAAVSQDIGHMLNQPAGFVVEASSALANNAVADPGTIKLTNAAEQAINDVITNATQDLINNRPFTTTTAEAIMATKNILNSVATQSAQLMNQTMEQLTSSAATNQQNIAAIEQATHQVGSSQSSPSAPIPMQTTTTPDRSQVVPMQQQTTEPQVVTSPQVVQGGDSGTMKKQPEQQANGMMTQDLMTDHELLNYINSVNFVDPTQGPLFM